MTPKKLKEFENMLHSVIATCRSLENKAQLALDSLAGGGRPAGTRKGKLNTQEFIIKRREKIFRNVNTN